MSSAKDQAQARLRASAGVILPGAAETLFRSHGLGLRMVSGTAIPSVRVAALCASVAFHGPTAEGQLSLLMTRAVADLLLRNLPTAAGDGIAELANQLLGRMVNRLAARGMAFHVRTPAVHQVTLAGVTVPDGAMVWRFESQDNAAWVILDARAREGFAVANTPLTTPVPGDVLVFN
jgi:hypothetical protein